MANAGIAQVKGLLELTEEDFERMFAVNVFGVNNCYQAAAKQMIKQGNCKQDNPGKLIGVSKLAQSDANMIIRRRLDSGNSNQQLC